MRHRILLDDRLTPLQPVAWPHPVQRPEEPLVVTEASRLLRELAFVEVSLLLAVARLPKGYAPDLHYFGTLAGVLRFGTRLALF
jgi:hypothetical protein